MHIEIFVLGKMYKEDALHITKLVESTLLPRQFPKSQWPSSRTIALQSGANYLCELDLRAMTDETFEEHKNRLINKSLEKSKKLGQATSRFWTHIMSETFDFQQTTFEAFQMFPTCVNCTLNLRPCTLTSSTDQILSVYRHVENVDSLTKEYSLKLFNQYIHPLLQLGRNCLYILLHKHLLGLLRQLKTAPPLKRILALQRWLKVKTW
jgi:hypothetical protein